MKERPILFSAPMVRAILAGTKSQTRRVVKPQPPDDKPRVAWYEPGVMGWAPTESPSLHWHRVRCPYGQPGDRLWVRETFYAFGRWVTQFNAKKGRDEWHFVDMTLESGKAYIYPASDSQPQPMGGKRHKGGVTPTWWKRPAIHMPRWASRITLEVTGVRVERLQDISEADAMAEGCTQNHNGYFWGGPHAVSGLKQMATATSAYRDLWEQINGPGSWDTNPWVWCVEFKRVEQQK